MARDRRSQSFRVQRSRYENPRRRPGCASPRRVENSQTVNAAASCEGLTSLTLPDTTITLAQTVSAGAFTPPAAAGAATPAPAAGQAYKGLLAFCRVAATLKPTSDSDIKVEVWLPADGWNGKFQAVGNGGWAGVISYSAMADAVRAGYASASTDTGHVGGSGSFALGHPEKLIDFGVAFRTRNDREGQGHHPGLLRQRAQTFVLERLLDRWQTGPQGSAEIS